MLCFPASVDSIRPVASCSFIHIWFPLFINFVCCCQFKKQNSSFGECSPNRLPCPCGLCDASPIKTSFYEHYIPCRHTEEGNRFCRVHAEEAIRRVVISSGEHGKRQRRNFMQMLHIRHDE